jgi:hypothetical protein
VHIAVLTRWALDPVIHGGVQRPAAKRLALLWPAYSRFGGGHESRSSTPRRDNMTSGLGAKRDAPQIAPHELRGTFT